MTVVLGTHDLKKVNDGTMRYKVKPCKRKDFNGTKFGNDIMLLKVNISLSIPTPWVTLCNFTLNFML